MKTVLLIVSTLNAHFLTSSTHVAALKLACEDSTPTNSAGDAGDGQNRPVDSSDGSVHHDPMGATPTNPADDAGELSVFPFLPFVDSTNGVKLGWFFDLAKQFPRLPDRWTFAPPFGVREDPKGPMNDAGDDRVRPMASSDGSDGKPVDHRPMRWFDQAVPPHRAVQNARRWPFCFAPPGSSDGWILGADEDAERLPFFPRRVRRDDDFLPLVDPANDAGDAPTMAKFSGDDEDAARRRRHRVCFFALGFFAPRLFSRFFK